MFPTIWKRARYLVLSASPVPGKSVGMLTLMGLLASNGRVEEGEILFDGENISPPHTKDRKEKRAYEKKMQQIRGNRIGMIFQDPMTFLNPILKIGIQMTEGIRKHQNCSKKEAEAKAIELMRQVGIPSPEKRLDQYPFEFSGRYAAENHHCDGSGV